ncbi:MAG: rubredoxin-like domain-containing protein [Halobacteriaceae archaeon]
MSGDEPVIDIGEAVYDADGERLGTVRGFDESGFVVTTLEGIEALSVKHERSTGTVGEAELAWRCAECGEMGDIDTIPDACPGCGSGREQLYYWTED